MKKPDFSKCNECKNKDTEKSNENWNVCPVMPVPVMLEGSNSCTNFIPIKE